MNSGLVVVQLPDIVRAYSVLITALAMGLLTVGLLTSSPFRGRVLWFVLGVDIIMVALLFGQLANVGRSITWRTVATAVGVTIITVVCWLEVRTRRRDTQDRAAAEETEDGEQSS